MYDRAVTTVRTSRGITSEFPITKGLHQRSTLSSYLFALVMIEHIKLIQEEVPWYICFLHVIWFLGMKLDVELMLNKKFGETL